MKKNDFVLDQTLAGDTFEVCDLDLCKVLLMNRAEILWFILVPKISNCKEIFELSDEQAQLLMKEIRFFSKFLNDLFRPDKINIASLGNVVSQLHIHIMARYHHDSAWPSPVFGRISEQPYDDELKNELINKINHKI